MKTVFKYFLLGCLTFTVSYLITDAVLSRDTVTFFVVDKYQDSFAATCAVVDSSDTSFDEGATGVLLNNGKIITAKHVVDNNMNGIIEDNEKDVLLKFYYPKEIIYRGRVIYAPPEKNVIGKGFDFVIIKPESPIGSNIRLQSLEDHYSMGAGEKIYTIGRKDTNIPTIIFGNQTTRVKGNPLFDRAHLDIWSGNSGGGVFRSNGELIGIISIKRESAWGLSTLWAGYIGAYDIRRYLRRNNIEHLVDYYKDTRYYKIQQTILYSLIALNCFLGVYFGRPILCEEVCNV